MQEKIDMQEIVNLCKKTGYIFPGSEIYGGLANSWDYGPLGVELKNNIKKYWWKDFVQRNQYNFGIDTAILMNPKTWEASGHIKGFSDPLMDCKNCRTRHRADKLIEEWLNRKNDNSVVDGWSNDKMIKFIKDNNIICPNCGGNNFTDIRKFNLMFKTFQGVTEDTASEIYLRPETAQGIFVNFKNVLRSTRSELPIGIAQIGKSFRNEITPGNFIFRVREFEQMEIEFFCKPDDDMMWFKYWKDFIKSWLTGLGIKIELLRLRDHSKDELSFYSKCTTDIEYMFPFGWGELYAVANRTDYDLRQHINYSGEDLSYFDSQKGIKYVPYCIEPSVSIERLILAILCSSYDKENISDNDTRVVLRLNPKISPIKACVLPLSKKLKDKAYEIYKELSEKYIIGYDDNRKYRKKV